MKSLPIPVSKVNRLLVTLDFSHADTAVLQYASHICEIFPIDKVYFLHIAKSFDLPDELREKYPFLLSPADERIAHQMHDAIGQYFQPAKEVSSDVEVVEGQVVEQVLKFARNKYIDIVLMGRKSRPEGSGMAVENIARKISCPTLFVPENWKPKKIGHIIVATDFSEHAHHALAYAFHISKETGATIQCVHVYQVPAGYHKSGKSYQEFSEIMKGHSEKEFRLMMHKMDIPTGCNPPEGTFLALGDLKRPFMIFNAAKSSRADLLIMGSRGRSKASAMLMGSVADGLVRINREIPLLVVKNKNENLDFFDALLKL